LATISVAAVGVAGVILGWLLVRTVPALLSTGYGRVLCVKVLLALAVMAGGAYNQRRLVPAVAAASAAAAGAWRRLRTIVRWEVAGLVLVVAATAVIAGMQPAAEAAGVTGALNTSVAAGDDGSRLSITVDPNNAGYNEIHLYLLDATGRPADVTDLQLRMTLPGHDIGPIVRTPSAVSPGHWLHAGRELAVPGRWRIEAIIGVSRFEQRSVLVTADVRP
jgi:copper transport protein